MASEKRVFNGRIFKLIATAVAALGIPVLVVLAPESSKAYIDWVTSFTADLPAGNTPQ
jgi:hypothetical protein